MSCNLYFLCNLFNIYIWDRIHWDQIYRDRIYRSPKSRGNNLHSSISKSHEITAL